jgi:hypothetical protein
VARRRIELRLDGARVPGPQGKRHDKKRDKTRDKAKPGRPERRQKIRGDNRKRSKARK